MFASRCFLTIRRCHTGPLSPGSPALTHEIIEARHPPIQSSHYFYCAFTHRHHHCAASSLRHMSRSRQDRNFLRARTWDTHTRRGRVQEQKRCKLYKFFTTFKHYCSVAYVSSLKTQQCEMTGIYVEPLNKHTRALKIK